MTRVLLSALQSGPSMGNGYGLHRKSQLSDVIFLIDLKLILLTLHTLTPPNLFRYDCEEA